MASMDRPIEMTAMMPLLQLVATPTVTMLDNDADNGGSHMDSGVDQKRGPLACAARVTRARVVLCRWPQGHAQGRPGSKVLSV